jgi:hypothetical protein
MCFEASMMELSEELQNEFESVGTDVQAMNFAGRALELQKAAWKSSGLFLKKLSRVKKAAVRRNRDRAANEVLAMELAILAVRFELRMWIELGLPRPERAWDQLINAQEALESAAAVRRQLGFDANQLDNLLKRLLFIERWVFPPQTFLSVGGVAARRECSICGACYEECDHIAGRAYGGKLCAPIVREFLELHEVSIVPEPADKRCRVTHFSDSGKSRNKMTWRLESRTRSIARQKPKNISRKRPSNRISRG